MPGSKSPGPSIKNPKAYEAIKAEGYSKEQAARISNAQAKRRAMKGKAHGKATK